MCEHGRGTVGGKGDQVLKIILLGDSAVGKSKLVERFLMDGYEPRQGVHTRVCMYICVHIYMCVYMYLYVYWWMVVSRGKVCNTHIHICVYVCVKI